MGASENVLIWGRRCRLFPYRAVVRIPKTARTEARIPKMMLTVMSEGSLLELDIIWTTGSKSQGM